MWGGPNDPSLLAFIPLEGGKGGGGTAALGGRGSIHSKFLRLGLGKKALSCRLLEIMAGL